MSKRRRSKRIDPTPFTAQITNLSHEGRGISHIDGKAIFIRGALPGETVEAKYTHKTKNHDSAQTLEILENPSPQRIEPNCPHFGICGGCALQHLHPTKQIEHKQQILLEQLQHFAGIQPKEILQPLTGPLWHYRHKARLGVRYVRPKDTVLVGFREAASSFLSIIDSCAVLAPPLDTLILPLRDMLYHADAREQIPQIEVAIGENDVALIFRHLQPLSAHDKDLLINFAKEHDVRIYLQPKGPDTVSLLYPDNSEITLNYTLPDYDLDFKFHPMAFIQINALLNRAMLKQALNLLEANAEDTVLDLFCGIGNFSLPIARSAKHVIGIEGSQLAVNQAKQNAEHNQINNCEFHVADLYENFPDSVIKQPWMQQKLTKLLLDPPRSGALAIVQNIKLWNPERIVYVACDPSTLARDIGELIKQGYELQSAGVIDMFPHTSHVESMALLIKV